MAVLHPFRAVRPVPDKAAAIASVPYDVINSEEARELATGNPLSFLHIVRPEIDLSSEIDVHDAAVYDRGAENLKRYVDGPFSLQEEEPTLYMYRIIMDGRAQTGIFGCVSVSDYDDDIILKHEKTRPEKEDDRTRHILTQGAHAEPIMLTFRDHADVSNILAQTEETEPLYDLTSQDGVRHTIWKFEESDNLVRVFRDIENLYVADGHHRCKAASRASEALTGKESVSGEVEYFPAVLFPMGMMHIMAYNRIIRKLPEAPGVFLERLRDIFTISDRADPVPSRKGDLSILIDGNWVGLTLPETARDTVADGLDVGRLTEYILEPLLNITDPRRDPNIDFVGGIRGTDELERLVSEGKAEMAISMFPTSIEELVDVSDAGLLMPPKSTWFEPKLRSGLLVHLF